MASGDVVKSEDEGDDVAFLLRDAQRSLSRALADRIAGHGVTIGQWYFLRALWEEDGLTQRELSQRVGMMEPTTVAALNGMERRKLVRRVRNQRDRRKINIHLTELGQNLRNTLMPCEEEVNMLAVDGLSGAERRALHKALQQVARNLNNNRR